jgi:hypothetical protein
VPCQGVRGGEGRGVPGAARAVALAARGGGGGGGAEAVEVVTTARQRELLAALEVAVAALAEVRGWADANGVVGLVAPSPLREKVDAAIAAGAAAAEPHAMVAPRPAAWGNGTAP